MRCRLVVVLGVVVAAAVTLGPPAGASGFAAPATFSSTGAEQSYTVPSGVTVEGVLVQGAWGGSADPQPPASNTIFAPGATLQGYLPTTPGQKLYTEVGQNGTAGGGAKFGGGGAAGGPPPGVPNCGIGDKSVPCSGPWAGSGGGASDVRTCSELAASCPGGGTSAGSRLIVAAGGGRRGWPGPQR
jgi:Glycine rich protein